MGRKPSQTRLKTSIDLLYHLARYGARCRAHPGQGRVARSLARSPPRSSPLSAGSARKSTIIDKNLSTGRRTSCSASSLEGILWKKIREPPILQQRRHH